MELSTFNKEYNHTLEYCCDYSSETIYTMLSFLLFISFFPSFVKIWITCCDNNYYNCKLYQLQIYKVKSNDNLLLDECSICLEKYKINDKIIKLNCNHEYHKNCIVLWIKNNNTCPHCRENII